MATHPKIEYRPEDYLAYEREAETKSEYYDLPLPYEGRGPGVR